MTNYSLHALGGGFILAASPAIYSAARMLFASGKYDNAQPRQFLDKLQGKVPEATFKEIARAKAACANNQEHYPLFAAAVLAANMATIAAPPASPFEAAAVTSELNTFVAKYLLGRIAFIVLYVKTPESYQALSYVRSGVWLYTTFICIAQLVAVGRVLA